MSGDVSGDVYYNWEGVWGVFGVWVWVGLGLVGMEG